MSEAGTARALPSAEEDEATRLRQECEILRVRQKELEACLREAEAHAAKREAALRAMADEFQQFAYAASHDLQEPLRAITSYTQLIERRCDADPEMRELLGYVIEGSARMTVLIRDLLAYSRVPENPRRSAFRLDGVMEAVRLKLYRELTDSGASLTQDDLPELIADEALITQLVSHLASNAIKFRSAEAPRIHVSAIEGDGEVVVSVRDNGQGIAKPYQEQIFGVFKRLHGRGVPGTGMGLAVCRKIARNHGGRLWVESDGSTGSTFFFSLPQ